MSFKNNTPNIYKINEYEQYYRKIQYLTEEIIMEAGVRNKVSGEIEAIKSDEIMAEVKMRGT